mmetsp:Transcript_66287/g.134682  ORF Transcript_66287/g.134682 Transcript_66287/m.134682 type:complete len:203 (-) Transcript_66287:106-714(-)
MILSRMTKNITKKSQVILPVQLGFKMQLSNSGASSTSSPKNSGILLADAPAMILLPPSEIRGMAMRSLDNCSMLLLLPEEEAPESATISSRSTSSAMPRSRLSASGNRISWPSASKSSCDCDVSRLEASLFKQVCRHHKPCLGCGSDGIVSFRPSLSNLTLLTWLLGPIDRVDAKLPGPSMAQLTMVCSISRWKRARLLFSI